MYSMQSCPTDDPQILLFDLFLIIFTMGRRANMPQRHTVAEGKSYLSLFDPGVVTISAGVVTIRAVSCLNEALGVKVGYVLAVGKNGVYFN